MGEVERHEMPNGSVVFYRDSQHAYFETHNEDRDTYTDRIPGISTVAKHDGDANVDPLMDWAVRLAYEGVAREASLGLSLEEADDMRMALGWLESGEAVESTLRAEGLLWRDVRDSKGKTGIVSHGVLQALAEGVTPILRTGWDHAVADWWAKRQPEVLQSECVVYSAKHRFAGRFDIRAVIRREARGAHALPELVGKTALTDAKVSGFISNAYHVQTAGYEMGAIESGYGPSDVQMILQLKEDGTWHEWGSHATPGDFPIALATYRMGRRISNAARSDWKAWKNAEEVAA